MARPLMKPDAEEFTPGRWWQYPVLRNALLSGLFASVGFALAHLRLISGEVEVAFYLVAIPLGSYHWSREALNNLFRRRVIGIDLLMLAAAIGSCILGLWDEAAFLASLYGAAEGVEEYTHARTRVAIRALLDLAPKEAHLLRNGEEATVAAETLRPGDRFLVRPGEAVPTDGIIRSGSSSLNESSVTGESVPVDKGPGSPVFAGTLNRQGALEVEATASFADNTLARIVHLVEEAQEQKGRAQQWIESFGRRYSPAVLLTAALLVLVPWLWGLPLAGWSVRAVVLLVAAAPCALVMSTPVAMAAGIGAAGRRGILIKGGAHLEHLGAIRTVAFDKTGTLTKGKPTVVDVIPLNGGEAGLLSLAAGIERFSEHPLAQAIVDHARAREVAPAEVRDFEALAGAGAKALFFGATCYIGKPDLFLQLGVSLAEAERHITRLEEEGKTVVLVGSGRTLSGMIALQDRARAEAAQVVRGLRAADLRVVMLTGDNIGTGRAVGRALGIADIRAGLGPEDKVKVVRELERTSGAVLMVGDGVNDAPALAAATCGMAMGVAGSDAAIEAADVALMADDLAKVSEAMALGRHVRRVSRQNIVFSILVLAVLVPAALSGMLSVAVAVLVHEVSELLAVANGLRVVRG